MKGALAFLGFALTVPAANWLIGNFGLVCVPDGPCLVPVWPGLMAPSGVLVIGLALVLRDEVHRRLGLGWAFRAILLGACLSALFAPSQLVVASGVAFLLSEVVDLAVYAPLWRRRQWLAVLASGVAGALFDSAVFLLIAFGTLDHFAGNAVGKIWMSAAWALVLVLRRKARA